ncbi:Glutathione S-transferase [Shewanella piezotolerans WP3]|uniref:Glutathione S-transferase n=1 Tax=Shewanella piezotolerans (strain WP3 / JCM 13877) TaxID=225849 RepID=B8CJD0_SHEPW|nr:Glutathione S-transferase [Shewanella piezotolerans WP3]
MSKQYTPANVWTMDSENGGEWASINRPDSGARYDKALPVGKHPIQLHSLATPNGQKVTIMLEELLAKGVSGAEYDAYLINIGDSDQFSSGFVEINPNSKFQPSLITLIIAQSMYSNQATFYFTLQINLATLYRQR